MPSVPMVTPSLMAMVLNSMGVPPAARMPSFTLAARRRRWKLQGMVSIQVLATPMMGLREIVVGEADRLEHGARRSAVAPVGDTAAAMLEIHRGRRLRQWSLKGKIRALVVLTATFSDHSGGSMSAIAGFVNCQLRHFLLTQKK